MPAGNVTKAQTTKQAKAAYKARGRPTITDKEARQLERSVELEQRAERTRNAEKRRALAAKKKTATEEGRKAVFERERARLGTQRRCDQFGHKSSQYHLGAFFEKGMSVGGGKVQQSVVEEDEEDLFEDGELDDDSLWELGQGDVMMRVDEARVGGGPEQVAGPPVAAFEDDDLDDESLMQALEPAPMLQSRTSEARAAETTTDVSDTSRMTPLPLSLVPTLEQKQGPPSKTGQVPYVDDDLSDIFNELESSTQISRDLQQCDESDVTVALVPERKSSFDEDDFDLTAEDMEGLDPPAPVIQTRRPQPSLGPKQSMAPPPLPIKHSMPPPQAPIRPHVRTSPSFLPVPSKTVMPPPGLPTTRITAQPRAPMPPPRRVQNASKQHQPSAIRGPFLPASSLYCSPEYGFTATQLECFIDDDIQLTQA